MELNASDRKYILDREEAGKCWLSPADTLDLAYFARDEKARVLLNNLSAKGLIPFQKSGDKKTSPRLYSLESAVKFAIYWNYAQGSSDFEMAALVSEKAVELLHVLISLEHQDDLEPNEDAWVIACGRDFNGAKKVKLLKTFYSTHLRDQKTASPRSLEGENDRCLAIPLYDLKKLSWIRSEVFYPHYLIERIIERYANKMTYYYYQDGLEERLNKNR